ncbi:352_t:CDS:2, partial [Cetraspora pellucida]
TELAMPIEAAEKKPKKDFSEAMLAEAGWLRKEKIQRMVMSLQKLTL